MFYEEGAAVAAVTTEKEDEVEQVDSDFADEGEEEEDFGDL